MKLLGGADIGGRPDWVAFTPDSRLIYIATENRDTTVALDVATRQVVAKIPVGKAPKRVVTMTMR